MKKGKLIAIEGIDGSGKTLQSKLLVRRLSKNQLNVKYKSFPTYGTKSNKLVEQYLNGDLGTPEYLGPYVASMFYAFNRAKESNIIKKDLEKGISYVLNRYSFSNVGHQLGKIKDEFEKVRYIDWLFELEFGMFDIPRPDLNILLHVPAEISQFLIDKRNIKSRRGYLKKGKKDVHEKSMAHLKNAEESYLYLANNYPTWKVIECVDSKKLMRKPEKINQELYAIVNSFLSS